MDKNNLNKKITVWIIIILVMIIGLTGIIYYKYFICIAEFNGRKLIYNGAVYKEYGTSNYELGDFLCKTKDGRYTIYSIRGDTESNFLEVSSFLDNYLYKKDDYEVPSSGRVTGVFITGYDMQTGEDFISVLQELESVKGERYSFETDNIYSCSVNITYCFNNCPVGRKWIGRIAHIDGKWIYIINNLNDNATRSKDGSNQISKYEGIVIDNAEYISILKKYLSKYFRW